MEGICVVATPIGAMSRTNDKRRSIQSPEDWERVLAAAAHLQEFVPEAILVGGTAAAVHADRRFSYDDDHVVRDLSSRFEEVLQTLESQAGWKTNRVRPPVLILGNLDGVETGVRNLIRSEPLETEVIDTNFGPIVLPTLAEMARIKAWLIETRNATRDYIDFIALADKIEQTMGDTALTQALLALDRLYPQENGSSVVLQLAKQLAEPKPHDLGDADLSIYRLISDRWGRWENVREAAQHIGVLLLSRL